MSSSIGCLESSEPSQKVRVSFFESSRPQQIPGDGSEAFSAPDALLPLRLDAAAAAAAMAAASLDPNTPGPIYVRQGSTDSGWDNPFRPDGDLSREADEIVELIKGGKPITPTPNSAAAAAQEAATIIGDATDAAPEQRNGSAKVNGAATKANATPLGAGANAAPGGSPSGPVDVHRATVAPAGDVEHVVLKKKPKCKCCVIQ